MSTASATRTIKFISKSGTYSALIMSPSGDLYQEYSETNGQVGNISPNFESTKPVLYFVCTSSRVSEGIATPNAIEYYFNGTKITFSGDTSAGTFAGMFKKISPSTTMGSNPYYGLQILKNIVSASNKAPANIKMVATISYGMQSDNIEASYTIPIQKAAGNSFRVTIMSGDNNYFVIREKGGNCKLKAVVYQAGTAITTGLSYVWEKMGQAGWVELTGKTAQTLTVKDSDIDTYGEFRATVMQGNAELGKDIQGVMDASDPYVIDPMPNPEDETITEDASGNGQVVYTPQVVSRGGTPLPAMSQPNFYFIVRDAVGNILNAASSGAPKASETVTRAQCQQAGGDVSIMITSQSF